MEYHIPASSKWPFDTSNGGPGNALKPGHGYGSVNEVTWKKNLDFWDSNLGKRIGRCFLSKLLRARHCRISGFNTHEAGGFHPKNWGRWIRRKNIGMEQVQQWRLSTETCCRGQDAYLEKIHIKSAGLHNSGMIDLPSMASTLTTMGEHETVCSQILRVTLWSQGIADLTPHKRRSPIRNDHCFIRGGFSISLPQGRRETKLSIFRYVRYVWVVSLGMSVETYKNMSPGARLFFQ